MFPANLKYVIGFFLTASVLAAALLLLAGPAPATAQSPGTEKEASKQPAKQTSKWPGEWLFEGKEDQPCAIFQHGRVLLLVNEEGELATGRVSGANTLTVLKGSWEEGLTGTLSDDGKSISWGNGTTWKRP
jgi:hypothetical protein